MKSCITAIALGLTAIGYSQNLKESEVPAAVKNSFKGIYNNATVTKWEKEDGQYEAEFTWEGKKTDAIFNEGGEFQFQEQEVEINTLPKAVKDAVVKKYVGFTINEAELVVDPTGVGFFQLELKNGKNEIEIQIQDNGELIKESKEEEGGDDESSED
ncbi:MAG: PepSY-like domain-containing protein [Bacteroidia bacterium]